MDLPERGRTILGKSSLDKRTPVHRVARDAAEAGDWVTPPLRIPSGADPLKLVAAAILKLADQEGLPASREQGVKQALERVQAVAVSGISLSLRQQQGPEPYTALTDLLVEVGRAAMARGEVMVLIHIDEMQNITEVNALSQLLIGLGDAIAHEEPVTAPGGLSVVRSLPIAVYLTELPDFADMAGARTGATFARRIKTTMLTAIADDDLASALQPFVIAGRWPHLAAPRLGSRDHRTRQALHIPPSRCGGVPHQRLTRRLTSDRPIAILRAGLHPQLSIYVAGYQM